MKIGDIEVVFPEGHQVPHYYELDATYGHGPWGFLFESLSAKRVSNPTLLDIGANIGDSAAHFRDQSMGKIVSLEANPAFFKHLELNARSIGNIQTLLGAYVANKTENLAFDFGPSTGSKVTVVEAANEYQYTKYELQDLLKLIDLDKKFVVKTDLDGWDVEFLKALIEEIDILDNMISVFSEGPSENQVKAGVWEEYLTVIDRFLDLDWNCYLFTNRGALFYEKISKEKLREVYRSLEELLPTGKAPAHFFDFVLVRN